MVNILEYKFDRFEQILAWARYLYWADLHKRYLDAWMEADHDVGPDQERWEFFALMSAWSASLWVVIEGWEKLSLKDPSVDELIEAAPQYVDLLRRYRNGVYHFQPKLIESRLVDFLGEGEGSMFWTHLLHDAFCHYYWELLHSLPLPPESHPDFLNTIKGIVGWIPDNIPEANMKSARDLERQAIMILKESGDFSSPAARDLLQAVQNLREVAGQAELKIHEINKQMFNRFKQSGK